MVRKGKPHLWQQHYYLPLPYYPVFGKVACRSTTSKILGIDAGERSWGAVKNLKTDMRGGEADRPLLHRTDQGGKGK